MKLGKGKGKKREFGQKIWIIVNAECICGEVLLHKIIFLTSFSLVHPHPLTALGKKASVCSLMRPGLPLFRRSTCFCHVSKVEAGGWAGINVSDCACVY